MKLFRDEYPGQEKLLLLGVRVMLLITIVFILGSAFAFRIADPFALMVVGVCAYGLYELRRF